VVRVRRVEPFEDEIRRVQALAVTGNAVPIDERRAGCASRSGSYGLPRRTPADSRREKQRNRHDSASNQLERGMPVKGTRAAHAPADAN
jgi:hypothetical protein